MHPEKQIIGNFLRGQLVRDCRFLLRHGRESFTGALRRKDHKGHGSFVTFGEAERVGQAEIAEVSHHAARESQGTRGQKQTHHRVARIEAAVAIGAIAVLPRLAPED